MDRFTELRVWIPRFSTLELNSPAPMVQEMQHSSTEYTRGEKFAGAGLCSKEIEKLRTFSRSLENLNSETLYSKWKRSRGDGSKSARRPRSISLTTAPNITYRDSDNHPQCRNPARKNSFHVLQENVFRPRCWTIGASPMEVIKEHALHSLDLNNNTGGSVPQWEERRRKLGQQLLRLQHNKYNQPPADKNLMESVNGTEIKSSNVEEKDIESGKVETTSDVFNTSVQKLRRVSEDSREYERSPIVAQFVSEEVKSGQIAKSNVGRPLSNPVIESMRVEIPPQSMSMPASPNFLMRKPEYAWDTVESQVNPSVGPNSTVVKDASGIRVNNDKSNASLNTFSLGCAYAVVSQPSPRAKENSLKPAAKMSNGITKEQREELEEEFKKLKKVSLELDRAEIEEGKLNKLYTLPEVISPDGVDSHPFRRFSELNNSFSSSRNCSSRPTAKALLEIFANASHKTEKERIQQIEKAFEWIRKELAELRAQDKHIMRTFTKIQAGIRKIKLQRALSSDMDEPYEFDIVDHTVDLSASFSYVPVVKDFHNTFPRRASLI